MVGWFGGGAARAVRSNEALVLFVIEIIINNSKRNTHTP